MDTSHDPVVAKLVVMYFDLRSAGVGAEATAGREALLATRGLTQAQRESLTEGLDDVDACVKALRNRTSAAEGCRDVR